ncbi:flagellar protein FliT [Niallia nealsonii]|uniref:Flagellar protein FliT n=1 Tax=Niallia nealsonii TaxID=115979 RepID=A0A2N0YXV1_9BACI|nr:flagellar protein FliT [Niallia nealsonii]PKG22075.1 flagellar protein FliT [Niallia nealsonii]
MESYKQLFAVTSQLIELVKEKSDQEDFIKEMEELFTKRQACLSLLSPPKTDSEKKLGQALMQQDQELKEVLQQEKLTIQQELKQLKVKKTSNQKYVNPYQALQTDGMFYDKRK